MDRKEHKRRLVIRRTFLLVCILMLIGALGVLAYSNSVTSNTDATTTASTTSTIQIEPVATSTTSSTLPTTVTTTPPKPVSTIPAAPSPVVIPAATFSSSFGMSVGQSLLGLSDADLNAQLNDMASLGIGWIRFDIQWDSVQPKNSGTFNWSDIDQLVAAANKHHIKLLAILDYTPAWARGSNCAYWSDKCLPADPAQFAAFAKAAVARYAPMGIYDWEIWNEPNMPGSVPTSGNAAAYAALLKVTYTAIKAQNRAAFVITGGLGPAKTGGGSISPVDFLLQLYGDGDKNYFDAVGMHPYSYPAMPAYYATWNAWSQMSLTTPNLRSIMTANGDTSKQIWITEYGAPTGGPGLLENSTQDVVFHGQPDHVTETVQSAMIAQAMTLVKQYPWVGPMFIYSYKDLGNSPSTIENFFGVVRNDGTTKPSYQSIKTLISS